MGPSNVICSHDLACSVFTPPAASTILPVENQSPTAKTAASSLRSASCYSTLGRKSGTKACKLAITAARACIRGTAAIAAAVASSQGRTGLPQKPQHIPKRCRLTLKVFTVSCSWLLDFCAKLICDSWVSVADVLHCRLTAERSPETST